MAFIVGPGGAADEEKQNQQGNHEDKETLNDRFQEKFTQPKKLSPGDSYNVENLTITVKDPCDQSQHSVTKKGEEIKLKVSDKWRTSLCTHTQMGKYFECKTCDNFLILGQIKR